MPIRARAGRDPSTIAVRVNQPVLLLDADSQGSALDWSAARQRAPAFTVVGLRKPTVHKEFLRLSEDYDHVVIDGLTRVVEIKLSVIMANDLVAIPVQPSPYDVWALKDVVELVKEARVYKEILKAAFVINRKMVNTAIGRDVVEALATYDLAVLSAAVCQRVAFAESAARGSTGLTLSFLPPGAVPLLCRTVRSQAGR